MSGDVSVHVVVRGRVQGVGYRAFIEREAALRGLRGWVRNRRDGTVEAVLSGRAEAVREAIECCRAGPPAARVETIDQRAASAGDLALGGGAFTVLPTA